MQDISVKLSDESLGITFTDEGGSRPAAEVVLGSISDFEEFRFSHLHMCVQWLLPGILQVESGSHWTACWPFGESHCVTFKNENQHQTEPLSPHCRHSHKISGCMYVRASSDQTP